jgi:hypothetical protein
VRQPPARENAATLTYPIEGNLNPAVTHARGQGGCWNCCGAVGAGCSAGSDASLWLVALVEVSGLVSLRRIWWHRSDMSTTEGTYRPGQKAPVSGFNECGCGDVHRVSTDVAGHVLPPWPQGCSGGVWQLKDERPV